ncbi:hypothetical protein AgCh_028055 [Apium graveolens]
MCRSSSSRSYVELGVREDFVLSLPPSPDYVEFGESGLKWLSLGGVELFLPPSPDCVEFGESGVINTFSSRFFVIDLYAFVIESYVIWTVVAAVLLKHIWKWCDIVLKSSVLLSIWIFIIPVVIELLFELLVIVPMMVPVDESHAFFLYQDWALGLSFLKICTRLEELKYVGRIESASRSCKEVADYVIASSDPLITT